MADDFTNLNLHPGDLKPGDLITSELMNWLLKRISDLEASIGAVVGGPITVPNLFGRTVSDVQALLGQPAFQLVLGTVLDTFGVTVLPASQGFATRVVLAQSPPPGSRVPAQSGVALVVAANPSAVTNPGNQKPSISGFNPTTQNAGEIIRILGSNFAALNTANIVRFGTATADPPGLDSNPSTLVVRIPTTIPGLPAQGSSGTMAVNVTVTTNGLASDPMALTVGAQLPRPAPNIVSITPSPLVGQRVGQPITITGTAFVDTPATQVQFDTVRVDVPAGTSLSDTQIVVNVPAGISGLGTPGSSRVVPITVLVGSRASNAVNYSVNS